MNLIPFLLSACGYAAQHQETGSIYSPEATIWCLNYGLSLSPRLNPLQSPGRYEGSECKWGHAGGIRPYVARKGANLCNKCLYGIQILANSSNPSVKSYPTRSILFKLKYLATLAGASGPWERLGASLTLPILLILIA